LVALSLVALPSVAGEMRSSNASSTKSAREDAAQASVVEHGLPGLVIEQKE
jgi:hypothetical protein